VFRVCLSLRRTSNRVPASPLPGARSVSVHNSRDSHALHLIVVRGWSCLSEAHCVAFYCNTHRRNPITRAICREEGDIWGFDPLPKISDPLVTFINTWTRNADSLVTPLIASDDEYVRAE